MTLRPGRSVSHLKNRSITPAIPERQKSIGAVFIRVWHEIRYPRQEEGARAVSHESTTGILWASLVKAGMAFNHPLEKRRTGLDDPNPTIY